MIDNSSCTSNYLKSEKTKAHKKEYYLSKKEQLSEYNKEYRERNKDKIKALKENRKLKIKDNVLLQERIRKSKAEYVRNKRQSDPLFKLSGNIRNLIKNSFNRYIADNKKNSKKTVSILGCTFSEFKDYMSSLFTDHMDWDNYGTYWEIDHIIPICTAYDEEQMVKLNHYTNLRPLEIKENRVKGGKNIAEL